MLQDRFREELARLKPAEQTNMLQVLQQIGEMMGAAELTAAPLLITGADQLADGRQSRTPKGRPKKVAVRTR